MVSRWDNNAIQQRYYNVKIHWISKDYWWILDFMLWTC